AASVSAVVNAGSFAPGAIAPGEIPDDLWIGIPCRGQVDVRRHRWAVIFVSSGQINVVAPYEIGGKASISMTALIHGVQAPPLILAVAAAAPGIFIVLNHDYSINWAEHPARLALCSCSTEPAKGKPIRRGSTARWRMACRRACPSRSYRFR